MAIVFAILLFSLLIFVHELGHFLAAKASKVQVNEFAMFMGPALLKKKVGETVYSLRCIPIGGYCAMEGEDTDTENPRSFQKAAWWKRLIILVAGSFMNLVAGFLLLLIVFSSTFQYVPTSVIDHFDAGCTLNGESGLQVGDRIVEVDGERIYVNSDISMILALNPGNVHDLVVQRNGQKVILNDFLMEPMAFPNEDGTTSYRYGLHFKTESVNVIRLLEYTANASLNVVRTVRLSLQMLITGQAGFSDMSGPVGIVQQMSTVADASETMMDALMNMLYFGGFIAINLAVMNMLPIPALDGGRVVALLLTSAIEAIIHKKINPKYEGYIHTAGMILLLSFMAIVMFKDIFVIFTR